MTALDVAREHMARTGLDGYTLAVLMECGPKCWAVVNCARCGRMKQPRGRSVPPEAGAAYCDWDCPGYGEDPQPPHLWGEFDESRCYTDLLFDLRYRAGEFDERDDDE